MAEDITANEIQTDLTTSNQGGGTSLIGRASHTISQLRQMARQPAFQRAFPAIVAVVVAFVALFTYLIIQEPSRTTLYASLPESEKSKVLDALLNSGVDASIDPTTGDVMVPVPDYHDAKMKLAAQGLPESVPGGYDTLGQIQMGTSRSVESMRLKQAQEIELARSVAEIDYVKNARVHLAIPEKSVFIRDTAPVTASVFIQLLEGRSLGSTQVQAIIHLVSSSISGLTDENVTIVDQYGKLLSNPIDDPDAIMTDAELQHRIRLENIYRSRVISLITPIVGAGNVSAQINLDLDFTRSEITEELVEPEGSVLRSEQNTLDTTMDADAKGVPGALANTPPMAGELKNQPEGMIIGEGVRSSSSSNVRNYEISKRIMTKKNASGLIKRIQAAVLVRETFIENEDGTQSSSISEETKERITALVKDVIGFDEDRGDNLTVSSSTFVPVVEGIEIPWYEKEFYQKGLTQAVMIIILAIVTFGVLRPLVNRILVPVDAGRAGEPISGGEDEELDLDKVTVQEGESLEDIKAKLKPKKQTISAEMLDTANTYDDKVAVIRMIVGDEAGRVSNVFKSMMKKDMGMV
ncbi:MAG: flagellar M-ring protein FliF [Alphaproteobacteria bacterium TMED87]|nr:MAG: flagellar M-ring protein FliF [Alphaproteobacteria bacterium TMED87]